MRLGRGDGVIYRKFDTINAAILTLSIASTGFICVAAGADAQETYAVQQGDTLASIASRIDGAPVNWADLCRINADKIASCDRLEAGLIIALPGGAMIADPAISAAPGDATTDRTTPLLRPVARPRIAMVDPLDSFSLILDTDLENAALQDADASLEAFFAGRVSQEPDAALRQILEAVVAEPVDAPDIAPIAPAPVADGADIAVVDADEQPVETPALGTAAYGAGSRPMAFRSFHGHQITDDGGTVRLSGHVPGLYSTGTTGGAFIRLDDAFEADAAAKVVRVSVTLSGPEGARAAMAYSTNDIGNSGWQSFTLTAAPTTHSFDYAVPPLAHGNGDFLGLDPDPDGAGHAILVHAILLEILESDPN